MPDHAPDPWHDDLLEYAKIGGAFTNLVKSIEDTKVISIEASFGQGKTYFRKNWAAQLRASGEVVVELDAQEADRTGDPLITLLGAMIRHVPQNDVEKWKKVGSTAVAMGGLAARTIAKMVLRNAADEVISAVQDGFDAKLPDNEILDKTMADIGGDLSKYAAGIIGSQLAAEKAVQELPVQLDALKTALAGDGRIVVLIDELDRCHPEYAIALLEAMKLVFNRKGFVFCLMVNPQYLENIAQHRFGMKVDREAYIDKFVDMRLALRAGPDLLAEGAKQLARRLPLGTPFGPDHEFSVERAAELAAELARTGFLSFRQIKRVLQTVELAIRCYPKKPLDLPFLVFLAMGEVARGHPSVNIGVQGYFFDKSLLPRVQLIPAVAERLCQEALKDHSASGRNVSEAKEFVSKFCFPLTQLNEQIYAATEITMNHRPWYRVLAGLGPIYLPEHEAVLTMVHEIQA